MQRSLLLVTLTWAVSAPIALAADRPARPFEDPRLVVNAKALAEADLAIAWKATLPLAITERIETCTLIDEHLYALSSRGTLFAVRAESGLVRWQTPVALPGDFIYPICHAESQQGLGPVLVTGTDGVRLLRRDDGEQIAKYTLTSPPATSARGDDDRLYLALADRRYVTCRRKDGVEGWTYSADATVTLAPVLHAGAVVFASDKGRMHMFLVGTREKLWTADLHAAILDPVYLSEQDLIFTAADHCVYSADPQSGPARDRLRWRYRLNGRPLGGPTVAGDAIYQLDSEMGLLALNRSSGEPHWTLQAARRFLSRGRGMVCLQAANSALLVVEEKTGKLRGSIPVAGADFFPSNVRTDATFIASRRGELMCLRPAGSEPLPMTAYLTTRPAGTPTTPAPAGEGESKSAPQPPAAEAGGMTAPLDPLRSPTR